MATGSVKPGKQQDAYLELVKACPLRPIRHERDLDRATKMIHSLIGRKRNRDEEDYLDVLTSLVEKYEEVRYPIGPANDASMLAFLIDQKPTTQSALAHKTGVAESTISAVINGTRKLTREQVGKVAAFFHVSPDVFSFEA